MSCNVARDEIKRYLVNVLTNISHIGLQTFVFYKDSTALLFFFLIKKLVGRINTYD